MAMTKRLGVATIILALAGGFSAVPVEPVLAQGLFERLFGSPRSNSPRYYSPRDERRAWIRQRERPQIQRQQELLKKPLRVDGERYYTYRPDPYKTVSFASLAEVVTASAAPSDLRLGTTPFGEARGYLESFKMRTLAEVGEAVKAYYAEDPAFIWVSDGRLNDRAGAAMAALQRAGDFGLSAADYQVEAPGDDLDAADEEARRKRLVEFEMEMSVKVLTYVLDATRGRIAAKRISGYHDLKRKKVDLAEALGTIAASDDVGAYLDGRHPDNAPFKALAAELAKLRGGAEEERIEIAAGTLLKPGAVNPEVANVVAAIRLRGSDALKAEHAATLQAYQGDNTYAPELVALVRDFQRENRLVVDGIVGKNTIRALTARSAAEKIEKIELAMERLRWLPRDLGARHVFVNQPAFTATYMNAGEEPLSMRAIVGRKSHQTAFFTDKLETVVYNPYWGVPRSILVNEYLDKLLQDPAYFDRNDYEVTTVSGEPVSSEWVDWYDVAVNKSPINVRQRPGPRNALGELKILFPNKHAIYMHDTPAKSLFNRDARAFSYGCVRLQDPRAMAAAVLGKSKDYITRRIAEGKNASERVKANIPIYLAYFTAWPDPQQGMVRYYDDMYDRDMYLLRAIKRTNSVRHVDA